MNRIIIQSNLRNGIQLFRYMKEDHLRTFRKEGILRLSRLSYYHQLEKLGKVIGDQFEGTSTVNLEVDRFEKTDTNTPPSAMRLLVGSMGTGAVVENCKVINTTITNNDLFCLCMSTVRSKKLQDDFEADGYFEIKKPDKFFKTVCKSIRGLNSAHLVMCEYSGRIKSYNMCNHDDDWLKYSYLKESEYSYQKEVRGLCEIHGVEDDHVFVKCFEATRFCKF